MPSSDWGWFPECEMPCSFSSGSRGSFEKSNSLTGFWGEVTAPCQCVSASESWGDSGSVTLPTLGSGKSQIRWKCD